MAPLPCINPPASASSSYTSSSGSESSISGAPGVVPSETSSSSSSSSSSTAGITSSSSSSITSSSHSSVGSAETDTSYWSTTEILRRYAERMGPISAPPNASMTYEPKRGFAPFITLGPVIGMVTETTARVLVETSEDVEVKCFCTDAYGVQHGVVLACPRETPVVFVFEELRAGTYYKVTFDLAVPGLVKAGFSTLPSNWAAKQCPARLAVVSTNSLVSASALSGDKSDLWKHLYNQSAKGNVDYLLHLGNNVFIDTNEYASGKAGREFSGKDTDNAYQEALAFCTGLSGGHLEDAANHVCDIFRHVYRETWSLPCTRHTLANVPNLMILGDMEISHQFDETEHSTEATRFVQRCAYRVYNEYCRALFEDVTSSDSDTVKIGQAYHFHAFGNIGLVFLDTKAASLFHRKRGVDNEVPHLGDKQWRDLEYALSDDGYLASCKLIMVCTSSPVAQISESGWRKAGKNAKKDLLGTWNTPEAAYEAAHLLEALFEWKAVKPGKREVVLLAGSQTDGGVSLIKDKQFEKTSYGAIKQVTAGPIAASVTGGGASLSGAPMCGKAIGGNYSFAHTKVIKTRNYAIVDVERNVETGNVDVSVEHMAAGAKAVVSQKMN